MKFTYINFLPFLDLFEQKDLKVSFYLNRSSNRYRTNFFQISSVLHHKNYNFPGSWRNNNETCLNSQSEVRNFLSKINDENIIPKYNLLEDNNFHFQLFSLLNNHPSISFQSIIHDQILNPQLMDKLEEILMDQYLNNRQLKPTSSVFLEYPIMKFYFDNMDTMSDQSLEENYSYLYTDKVNNIFLKFNEHNICPLEIMPINDKMFNKVVQECGQWLEKNHDDESVKKVHNFFNNPKYKNLFISTLQDLNNRYILDNYIFSIDKNTNENLKNSIYQNFPFLKFDMPTYTSLIKKDSMQLNIASIFKENKRSNIEEAFLQNIQKIINKSSKTYGLTPFKIKKFKNGVFSLETTNSDLGTNKKVAEFINIMLYELFVVAKPSEENMIQTLDELLPFIHSQVMQIQIPQSEVSNVKINKF